MKFNKKMKDFIILFFIIFIIFFIFFIFIILIILRFNNLNKNIIENMETNNRVINTVQPTFFDNLKNFGTMLDINSIIQIENNRILGLKKKMPPLNSSINMRNGRAFCEVNSFNNLDNKCRSLTYSNCNATNCCVWTSNNICLEGTKNGPTFNSDRNGKTINLDYYYFKNKCYGSKC